MANQLREVLNDARWHRQDLERCCLWVRHRGAPGDRREVSGAQVARVTSSGVELADGSSIPFHRVLRVLDERGAPRWLRAGEGAADGGLEGAAEGAARALRAPLLQSKEDDALEAVGLPDVVLEDGARLVLLGSAGEGGGQIVRTSLSLSLLTGRALRIDEVRGGRRKPGLLRQHLTCLRAAQEVGGAKVSGLELGASSLAFEPTALRAGAYAFDVGSAGSAALVAQTLLLPLLMAKGASSLRVRGGTHASMAPPADMLARCYVPELVAAGASLSMELVSHGFYPAGGGELRFSIDGKAADGKTKHRPLGAKVAPGESADGEDSLEALALVSNLSEAIARRELQAFAQRVNETCKLTCATVRSPGPGNVLIAFAERGGRTNAFCAFGAPRKSAEHVANEAAGAYLRFVESGAEVEEHLADQLMLPTALLGGSYTCPPPSDHVLTNAAVINAFLPSRIRVERIGAGPVHRISSTLGS
ncbi:MAG: RNA 3'-terminal phosphate cyclase [Myxococcota bacterium]